MNEEINESNAVDQQPSEQPAEQPSEQPAEDMQLSEEDLAFVLWSLQIGSYLHSLVTGDPLAAADEFEATAKHLRQSAQPKQEPQEQPKSEPQPQPEPKPEQPTAQQPDIQELVQRAVQQALQQAMTELRKSALRSPNSLNAPPASARRLADLIE
jgi:cell division protein FtsN